MELYEKMLKDPNAYNTPTQNFDQTMAEKAAKEGKPYIDPEGGCLIQPTPGFVIKTKDKNGQKIFLNMTSHELVDPPEQKYMPDSDQPAVRIPLSLGTVREDFDKKGDPCQVYDVIWNPEAIKQGQKEMLYRQGLVELAFEYIKEKYGVILDMKFTTPKLKYKGKTVQWQRVRAKKNPKIEQLDSKPLTEEDQKKIQEVNFSKIKDEEMEIKQQIPKFKLYCAKSDLKDKLVNEINFQEEGIEEYDGLNENYAFFVISTHLEMLMRGHAIKILTQDRKVKVDVPNLYSLTLNLPVLFDTENSKAYFDCNKRILNIVLPLHGFYSNDEKQIVQEVIAEPEIKETTIPLKTIADELTSDEMLLELV